MQTDTSLAFQQHTLGFWAVRAVLLPQVLVGAHAVLANGGVIAPAGIHMVALAAKRHSVPFVVLIGLHKLSPLFPHDPDVTFNGMLGGCCSAGGGVSGFAGGCLQLAVAVGMRSQS
jgi:hypothetical protein